MEDDYMSTNINDKEFEKFKEEVDNFIVETKNTRLEFEKNSSKESVEKYGTLSTDEVREYFLTKRKQAVVS